MSRDKPSKIQRTALLLRNLLIASLAYSSVVGVVHIYQTGSINPWAARAPRHSAAKPKDSSLSGGVNHRLRPTTLVETINDAFLGERPHVDTMGNYSRIVESCRGSAEKLEKMRNVQACLEYLTTQEADYFFVPETGRPSAAEKEYPAIDAAEGASESSIGQCAGPVVPYHTYWTGPSTWRVELFVKAYLYTQNLPCSRLYIWLDADTYPTAVESMLADPGFARFLPLVERGDITLKAWNFPSRIPLPQDTLQDDPLYASVYEKYLKTKEKAALKQQDSGSPRKKKETYIGDGVVVAEDDSVWLVLTERQKTFLPVAVSDAVRFVVLHLYGGVYFDMDVMLLRDMRPLLITPEHNFAERWAVHSHAGDYNTAVMSLNANTSLSSYLVRGGVRMGLNFHPRIIGRMAWKDGRGSEFEMFETGLFDPIWGEFNWGRDGRCAVPCFKDYGVVFKGTHDAIPGEWQSYAGEPLKLTDEVATGGKVKELQRREEGMESTRPDEPELEREVQVQAEDGNDGTYGGKTYNLEEDRYPPNNRTLENFFRGAWSYHIHNQWLKHPEPNSWFDVIEHAHDGFFAGARKNPYGELWSGPAVEPYERWVEYD